MFYGRRLFKAIFFFCIGDIIAILGGEIIFIICFSSVIALLGVVALFRIKRYSHLMKYFSMLLLGLLLGHMFFSFFVYPLDVYRGSRMEFKGYVSEIDDYNGHFTLKVTDKAIIPIEYSVRLNASDEMLDRLKEGNGIRANADISKTHPAYLIANKILLSGSLVEFVETEVEITLIESLYFSVKETIKGSLHSAFGDDDVFAVASGIIVGDRSFISPELKEAFVQTGTSHFLAISGLHLSLLAAIVFSLLRLITSSEKAAAIISIIIIVLYIPIPSFTPSVVRAAFVAILIFVTRLIDKKSDTVSSMSLALLVILVFNPAAILSVGLQLSFLATFGIIYSTRVSRRIEAFENRSTRLKVVVYNIVSSVKISTLALVFTTPVLILAFERFTLFAPIFNIILGPLFSIVLISGMIASWASLIFPTFSTYIVWILKIPIELFISIVRALGSFPFVSIQIDGQLVRSLAILLGISIFFAVLTFMKKREKDGKIFLFLSWGACIAASLLGF